MDLYRRKVLKTMAYGLAGACFGKLIAPTDVFAEVNDIVKLDGPTATALGYVHDASKVDVVKFPKRATPEGEKQFCSNCNFLQGQSAAINGQEGKWAGCQLFPGKKVNEAGWCNSWFAKS